MTTETLSTIEIIAVTYQNWATETGKKWMRIEELVELTGRTTGEINEGIYELMTWDDFRAEPQPFGHRITDWDRENAPVIGGEARHLICW